MSISRPRLVGDIQTGLAEAVDQAIDHVMDAYKSPKGLSRLFGKPPSDSLARSPDWVVDNTHEADGAWLLDYVASGIEDGATAA